jgi:hypothetical protein
MHRYGVARISGRLKAQCSNRDCPHTDSCRHCNVIIHQRIGERWCLCLDPAPRHRSNAHGRRHHALGRTCNHLCLVASTPCQCQDKVGTQHVGSGARNRRGTLTVSQSDLHCHFLRNLLTRPKLLTVLLSQSITSLVSFYFLFSHSCNRMKASPVTRSPHLLVLNLTVI